MESILSSEALLSQFCEQQPDPIAWFMPVNQKTNGTSANIFDFEVKYTPGMSEEITPAKVDESIAQKVRETAKKVYRTFNCRGVVRMDFIFHEEKKEPYLLEINTVPGQSEASIVPQQVKANGWTLKDFYSKLIEECF